MGGLVSSCKIFIWWRVSLSNAIQRILCRAPDKIIVSSFTKNGSSSELVGCYLGIVRDESWSTAGDCVGCKWMKLNKWEKEKIIRFSQYFPESKNIYWPRPRVLFDYSRLIFDGSADVKSSNIFRKRSKSIGLKSSCFDGLLFQVDVSWIMLLSMGTISG